uniref:GntR family transcriptional regulator n=1 Tax=Mycolicibacterium bacteremicum TaxID=564198 RepID=UPI003F58D1D0
MKSSIQVSQNSDVPIYRQIVAQLTYMIETGELNDGDRLPSTRLLADNLHINRNTAAHAYAELRERGLVESRSRSGMVVIGAEQARNTSSAREQARAVLAVAVVECLGLGLSAEEVFSQVVSLAVQAQDELLRVCFVECNAERSKYFSDELSRHLRIAVTPLVLGEFDPAEQDADLILTTFFHLAEVRKMPRTSKTEVVAIVVAPHVQTLVQIAQVPKDRRVGIWYATDDQATSVRDSLTQCGIKNVQIITGDSDDQLAGMDLVIIPSEIPELKTRLAGRVRIIEFGNVLDEASIRMASAVVGDLRAAKAGKPWRPALSP